MTPHQKAAATRRRNEGRRRLDDLEARAAPVYARLQAGEPILWSSVAGYHFGDDTIVRRDVILHLSRTKRTREDHGKIWLSSPAEYADRRRAAADAAARNAAARLARWRERVRAVETDEQLDAVLHDICAWGAAHDLTDPLEEG